MVAATSKIGPRYLTSKRRALDQEPGEPFAAIARTRQRTVARGKLLAA